MDWSKSITIDPSVIAILDETQEIGTVDWIFYEGGEPFLFFPLLNESIKRASKKGFKVGVVTNAYTAVSIKDAEVCLKPLVKSGLSSLSLSNDTFHYGNNLENPATHAENAARKLGIEVSPIQYG